MLFCKAAKETRPGRVARRRSSASEFKETRVAVKDKTSGETSSEPVVVKKYANRRLYNTATSSYVTLDDLSAMVKEGFDFVVYDAKSGDDITRSVLTQIIFEQESRGQNLLPIQFLRRLIRFYGDSLGGFVPSYLEASMEAFAKQQGEMRERFKDAWPPARAMEAFEDQARQNMVLFERAVRMFSPFAAGGAETPAAPPNGAGHRPEPAKEKPAAAAKPPTDDTIAELREQMAAMQRRLDKIQGGV
jgi:polyhydroxyalkanoate synthesis repressor PhaR